MYDVLGLYPLSYIVTKSALTCLTAVYISGWPYLEYWANLFGNQFFTGAEYDGISDFLPLCIALNFAIKGWRFPSLCVGVFFANCINLWKTQTEQDLYIPSSTPLRRMIDVLGMQKNTKYFSLSLSLSLSLELSLIPGSVLVCFLP